MYLAAKTTASPVETWAIVIVAVVCLAFWLVMVVGIAPRPDIRQRHRRQPANVPVVAGRSVPVAGGMHVAAGGRSVAPSRDEPAMEMPGVPETHPAEAPGEAQDTKETRDDLPTVPGQRQPQAPPAPEPAGSSPVGLGGTPMPAPRESATDQAAPSRPPGP
jgi:hypothetical protein